MCQVFLGDTGDTVESKADTSHLQLVFYCGKLTLNQQFYKGLEK